MQAYSKHHDHLQRHSSTPFLADRALHRYPHGLNQLGKYDSRQMRRYRNARTGTHIPTYDGAIRYQKKTQLPRPSPYKGSKRN